MNTYANFSISFDISVDIIELELDIINGFILFGNLTKMNFPFQLDL